MQVSQMLAKYITKHIDGCFKIDVVDSETERNSDSKTWRERPMTF